MITATVPTGSTLSSDATGRVQISNFLNPPYFDSCSSGTDCTITYRSIASGLITSSKTVGATTGFWSALSMQAGQVSNFVITASSLKANNINLTYKVTFNTVPRVPAGSILYFTMSAVYPPLSSRDPVGACSCSLAGATCSIYSYGVVIKGFGALAANAAVAITITGVKNPAMVGGATGFNVSVLNAQGKTVINSSQGSLSIEAASTPAVYSFTLTPSTTSAQMAATYVLKATTSATLYRGTYITLTLPAGFTMPLGVTCVDLVGYEAYQYCQVGNSNSIVLKTPTFSVTILGIVNPPAATSAAGFSLTAVYDGATLAASDATSAAAVPAITALQRSSKRRK